MPKYVAKEDVEKGLVDPSKSLNQQPQYKEKIQKETQEKQKLHQDKRPKNQRPKKQRPPRNQRPTYNWDRNLITLETKAPQKPKKLLQRPDQEKHYENVEKLKGQITKLRDQKKALFQQQKHIIHDLIESQKTGKIAISQFSGAAREKMNIQQALRRQIKALDNSKVSINNQLAQLQFAIDEYRRPNNKQLLPAQYIKQTIQEREHYLTTKNIDKKQQARVLNEITQLKRALFKARPSHQIQSQVIKLQDNINILYASLKNIKHELHIKITQDQRLRAEIQQLTNQRKNEQGQIKQKKTVQQIRAQFDVRFKENQDKINAIQDKIDDLFDKHTRAKDNYQDQQDLLKYIDWVQNQVTYLKNKKEEQEKKEKERQQRQKKRKREQQQYQRKKQQRRKQQQQRKARQEQRRIKRQKERQNYINRNPNHQILDLCQSLIGYCQSLRPNVIKYEPKERVQGQLVLGKQWNKQVKGGATIIQSKKTKLDQQAPKKVQKPKKKQQKAQDQGFNHGIQIINQFQLIQSLPPNNLGQIDGSIKFIKDKITFYSSPSQQQIQAFKAKSAKQWDQRHQDRQGDRQDRQGGRDRQQGQRYRQKQQRQGRQDRQQEAEQQVQKPKQKKRYERSNLSEQDFPGL